MKSDITRFRGTVPLIGGATVTVDQADPMDIVMAIRDLMPHYAQAVWQHVNTTQAMLGECVCVLKAAGMHEIRRAQSAAPYAGNATEGDNGDGQVQ